MKLLKVSKGLNSSWRLFLSLRNDKSSLGGVLRVNELGNNQLLNSFLNMVMPLQFTVTGIFSMCLEFSLQNFKISLPHFYYSGEFITLFLFLFKYTETNNWHLDFVQSSGKEPIMYFYSFEDSPKLKFKPDTKIQGVNRRRMSRAQCLIPAQYRINNEVFISFILDINRTGHLLKLINPFLPVRKYYLNLSIKALKKLTP